MMATHIFGRMVWVLPLVLATWASPLWANVDQIELQARETGRPILVIMASAAQVQEIQREFTSSPPLRTAVAAYLLAPVVYPSEEGSKVLGKWPPSGDTITLPFAIYVRGDGHVLASGTGLLTPAHMQANLARAGRFFTPEQLRTVQANAEKAQNALQEGDRTAAVQAVAPYLEMETYAQGVKGAINLAEQLAGDGEKAIEEALEKLGEDETLLAAVQLAAIQREYAAMRPVQRKASDEIGKIRRDRTLREVWAAAQQIDRAAEAHTKGQSDRAVTLYRQIVGQHGDAPAGQYALQQLAILKAEGIDVGEGLDLPEVDVSATAKRSQGFVGMTKSASWVRLAQAYRGSDPARAAEYARRAAEAQGNDADPLAKAAAEKLLEELGR